MTPYYTAPGCRIYLGDCREVLGTFDADSAHAIVTDPPYGLGFMGQGWDHGAPGIPFWQAALRVAKPGAHLVAFGGARTFHRLTCAIEDAGWEIRDCLMWLYGTGFPKSLDVAKAMDKAARGVPQGGADPTSANHGRYRTQASEGKRGGADRGRGYGAGPGAFMREAGVRDARSLGSAAARWAGWGTALKPAWEPIILARKPLVGTVVDNVTQHATGALNVDGARIGTREPLSGGAYSGGGRKSLPGDPRTGRPAGMFTEGRGRLPGQYQQPVGRWPANLILDEVAGARLDAQSGTRPGSRIEKPSECATGGVTTFQRMRGHRPARGYADTGGASRFFFCPKASPSERGAGNTHPTVKPLALMRWLVQLVTPPGGCVVDPFMGSGTTLLAARPDFSVIGIDTEAAYAAMAVQRLTAAKPRRTATRGPA